MYYLMSGKKKLTDTIPYEQALRIMIQLENNGYHNITIYKTKNV